MGLTDELEKVNTVLTFMERVDNMKGREVITNIMADCMQEKAVEYLETVFPPPPPET